MLAYEQCRYCQLCAWTFRSISSDQKGYEIRPPCFITHHHHASTAVAKALSKEAGKADLENLAVQRKSAQAEMRRVLVENRSIRTLMIKIAQSIKLLHDFLSIGETSSSEYNDEEKKKKQPQSVRSMLSPNVMVSSMQEIETKVVGILNKIIKDEFPDNKGYFSQIENNLNSIAAMKHNNIRIGTFRLRSLVFLCTRRMRCSVCCFPIWCDLFIISVRLGTHRIWFFLCGSERPRCGRTGA